MPKVKHDKKQPLTQQEIDILRDRYIHNWEKTWSEIKKDPDAINGILQDSLDRINKK